MCKFWLKYQDNKKQRIKKSLILQIDRKLPSFEENAKKAQSVSRNPHNKEYQQKLVELMNSRDAAQENFVNWITGIASGSIFWGLSKVLDPSLHDITIYYRIIFLICMAFLILFTVICYKLFSHNRFNYLELETEILGILYKSHELKIRIENDLKEAGKVPIDIEIDFLQNHLHNLNFTDPDYVLKIKKAILLKSKVLDFLYLLTVIFFVITVMLGLFMIL